MPQRTPSNALARSRRFVADRRGGSMVEYVIVVGVISMLAIHAFRLFGSTVRKKIDQQDVTVTQIESGS